MISAAAAPETGGGLPMAELIQVIREHPQLKSQIQNLKDAIMKEGYREHSLEPCIFYLAPAGIEDHQHSNFSEYNPLIVDEWLANANTGDREAIGHGIARSRFRGCPFRASVQRGSVVK